MTFSRQSPFQSQIVRLNDVIASSEKLLRRLIGEQISLTVNLDPDVAAIKADTNQLEQVLMNLAVNARDAMPNGGCLTITTSLVSAMHAQAGDGHSTSMPCAQLTITDTGIGIPKENQSRIFEPFFTTKAVGKGSGLGLSVVHGIMQQHNGVIRVTSQPNQGTTFTLLFPHLAQCPQPPDRVPPPAAQHGTETILLVEDEPAVRAMARQMLESNGYRVLDASNGREALRMMHDFCEPIQLLVTDVVMPDIGGRQLAEALRADIPSLP